MAVLQAAENIESLKTLYMNACKLVIQDPLALKSLEFAKDKRKQELEQC